MRVQKTPLHCTKCKEEWIGELILDAPVKVAAAVMQALHCPKCGAGARSVAFGRGDVPDPVPVQSGMSDPERRAEWLKLHDSGLSSCCIADKMCGMIPTGHYPHDGDDFGRCERLLMLYPAWRERFDEMASVNAHWSALVSRWDEIAEAWRHDTEMWRAGGRKVRHDQWKCSPLMRAILTVARERAS